MKYILLTILLAAHGLAAAEPERLTLGQARQLAMQNQPRIAAADLKALAAKEKLVQARAGYFPTLTANVTAVGTADENTRVAAGGLSNSGIFDRNAEGIVISQLITDFGRTASLADNARLRFRAEQTNSAAARAQVLLQVDVAYYSALQARAVKRVALATVKNRELLLQRVSSLATNRLKSELDVSFARVAVGEVQLLLVKAENNYRAAFASLLATIGDTNRPAYLLVDEPLPASAPVAEEMLISSALARRPELAALRLERDAAAKFARAEHALRYPTLSAIGTGGIMPVHDSRMRGDYGAAGINLSVPLFSGNLFSSRQREAEVNVSRLENLLREEENNVIRDVQIASQNVSYSQEQLKLVDSLLENATQALTLAETRYQLGSSSIVELSQAQLNQTAAEIATVNAKYEILVQTSRLNFQIGPSAEINAKTEYHDQK